MASYKPGENEEEEELEEEEFDLEDEDEFEFEEEEEEEEEFEEEVEEAKEEPAEEEVVAEEVVVSQVQPVSEEEIKKAPKPEEIPLEVSVEVGRLKIPIKTLMELQPGNLLDLNVHPESGVYLVVNGSRVAKGELLQVGDTLGVRITEN